jgi:serine/threonine protein kinase
LNREYSQKSDVFSFGVVVYEIVTRKIPWEGSTPVEASHKVANGERMIIPEDCPQVLVKIMQQSWEQDPKSRPEFKEILEWMLDIKRNEVRC